MASQEFQLSEEQRVVLNQLWQWLKNHKQSQGFITFGGYAGTGKTTSLGVFRRYLYKTNPTWKVAFASYTGKAARVLAQSLKSSGAAYKSDFIGTLHSLMYAPLVGANNQIISWERKKSLLFHLIIIDEASMVDRDLWRDLRSFGVPIIAVGDHGQLPPIHGSFNLMENPVLKLETIHRQAADNPIIQLSLEARTKGLILPGNYGQGVKKFAREDETTGEFIDNQLQQFSSEMLVLCGYNHTRLQLNNAIRLALGFEEPEPQVRDRVICLRNNREKDVYNGMLGTIQQITKENEDWYYAEIALDDEEQLYSGLISRQQFNAKQTIEREQLELGGNGGGNRSSKNQKKSKKPFFGDVFDFGYAITVHKAQGSQAKKVLLFEERFKQMDDQMWRRWLYTGVTRAQEELYIIGGGDYTSEK